MRLGHGLDAACKRIGKALHLDALKGSSARTEADPEWAIVYRTAQGFCCVYQGVAIDFGEMLDVQLWAEEMDVQTYFIGL
ncbi:hypothetical protein B0G76_5977 [Paraburkholderia sp. BL23I1N1]|uniref:hypothetical protein n=1 Tax=Paraburkholderia sp. BL23I1N1 TaxID=1938802 RepID=UPI000E742F3C|nr:hypothetical protein [Paraburkholderia sp. BL23I1N1]RKE39546.1 hypothetical protein B0G76_5977 [Paraburkholderia sp. BL23I1N1]